MSILKFRRRNDGLHVADALTERIPRIPPAFAVSDQVRAELAALVAQAEAEAQPAAPSFTPDPDGDRNWWGYGQTALDNRPPMPRPYVPLFDAVAADLGDLPLFRDTVHAVLVRGEERHCKQPQFASWQQKYPAVYRHRVKAVPEPDFDIERQWSA